MIITSNDIAHHPTISQQQDEDNMSRPTLIDPASHAATTQYARFVLLRRDDLPPITLRCQDLGNNAYNILLAARRILPVPQGAEKVVEDLERLSEVNYKHTGVLLHALLGICDTEDTDVLQDDFFDLCLHILVTHEIDGVELHSHTKIYVQRDVHAYILRRREDGWSEVRAFSDMTGNVLECLNTTIEKYGGPINESVQKSE